MNDHDDQKWLDALAGRNVEGIDKLEELEARLTGKFLRERQSLIDDEESADEADGGGYDHLFQRLLFRMKREGLMVRHWIHDEPLQLMAAADGSPKEAVPRIRTPNGFTITPFYRLGAPKDEPPMAITVECPEDQIEKYLGRIVCLTLGGQEIEVGAFGIDGKATGQLPEGVTYHLEQLSIREP